MGWFSNKKEGEEEIPQLPELPKATERFNLPPDEAGNRLLPETPSGIQGVEINSLPSLPDSDNGNTFNQEAIKHAINKEPLLEKHPQTPPIKSMIEKDFPRTVEIGESRLSPIKSSTKKIEPIYIRLDKFETTLSSFEEIKNKVIDIEKLLLKIKEVKKQEERELEEWEQEIQAIKARIESIDKTIFNKLD